MQSLLGEPEKAPRFLIIAHTHASGYINAQELDRIQRTKAFSMS